MFINLVLQCSTSFLYLNTDAMKWEKVPISGPPPPARLDHAMCTVLIPSGCAQQCSASSKNGRIIMFIIQSHNVLCIANNNCILWRVQNSLLAILITAAEKFEKPVCLIVQNLNANVLKCLVSRYKSSGSLFCLQPHACFYLQFYYL